MTGAAVRWLAWGLAILMLVVPLTPLVPEFWVTLLILIGLHAAAALFHHFIRQDDVLNAMLPARRRCIGRSVFALARLRRQT